MSAVARVQSPIANQAEGDFAGLVDIGGRWVTDRGADRWRTQSR
jgi:hypothetical protein